MMEHYRVDQGDEWARHYRQIVGRHLAALVWMPITCDTPQLVGELDHPTFSFSGAVSLQFGARPPLFLSWQQRGRDCVLAVIDEQAWRPHALDRVHASAKEPWSSVEGAQLVSVDWFTTPDLEGNHVVAVRHQLVSSSGTSFLWIGTGGPGHVGEGDDLCIGLNVDPPNLDHLVSVGTYQQ